MTVSNNLSGLKSCEQQPVRLKLNGLSDLNPNLTGFIVRIDTTCQV